jgi:hypothetical protein
MGLLIYFAALIPEEPVSVTFRKLKEDRSQARRKSKNMQELEMDCPQ